MSLKIVRNDITKLAVDAIVNTANEDPVVGDGCDTAVYNAAGRENLLAIRKLIGHIDEGNAAITTGLALPAKNIIHAVSPLYVEGDDEVEGRLRAVTFENDSEGHQLDYRVLSETIGSVRRAKSCTDASAMFDDGEWQDEIRKNYEKRHKA